MTPHPPSTTAFVSSMFHLLLTALTLYLIVSSTWLQREEGSSCSSNAISSVFCLFLWDIPTPFTVEVWHSKSQTLRLRGTGDAPVALYYAAAYGPALRQMHTCVFASARLRPSFGQNSSYSIASSPVSWLISVVPNTASSHRGGEA